MLGTRGRAGAAHGVRAPPPGPRAQRPAHPRVARRGRPRRRPHHLVEPARARAEELAQQAEAVQSRRGMTPPHRRGDGAGLTVPSSTRLLADQLAEATDAPRSPPAARPSTIEFIELREVAGDLATFMVTGGIPTPRLTELREQVAAADGLIAVTPVFNGSYSGLFKMFFDALDTDSLDRYAGAGRRDRRQRPALAGARPRAAAAVRLPARGRRTHRRLRRDRGLRQPRPLRPDHPRRGRAGRAGARARAATASAASRPTSRRARGVRPAPRSRPT